MQTMRILLTNDDGYDAPGLSAAYNALVDLGQVHVVAPEKEHSGCGHMITLRRPIKVQRRTYDPFGMIHVVHGSPADCVRLGVAELADGPIDLVVSGINRGANTGVDLFYSGTIGGAREGAILRIPSVAVSHAVRRDVEIDWAAATEVAASLIRDLAKETLPGPGFWSVNLPAPIPPKFKTRIHRVSAALEPVPMTFDRMDIDDEGTISFNYGASYWARDGDGPTDYSVVRDGGIAVTAVPLLGRF